MSDYEKILTMKNSDVIALSTVAVSSLVISQEHLRGLLEALHRRKIARAAVDAEREMLLEPRKGVNTGGKIHNGELASFQSFATACTDVINIVKAIESEL